MNRAVIVAAVALVGCSQGASLTCPSIDRLRGRNPVEDAQTAFARGDYHLLSLGGFVGVTPAVPDDVAGNATATVEIEGTSDTTSEACYPVKNVAEAYAAKYNQTIVSMRQTTVSGGLSCSRQIGPPAALNLVQQCIQVSPATHPPCNAENSCAMIQSEIKRGCEYIGKGQPSFCRTAKTDH